MDIYNAGKLRNVFYHLMPKEWISVGFGESQETKKNENKLELSPKPTVVSELSWSLRDLYLFKRIKESSSKANQP